VPLKHGGAFIQQHSVTSRKVRNLQRDSYWLSVKYAVTGVFTKYTSCASEMVMSTLLIQREYAAAINYCRSFRSTGVLIAEERMVNGGSRYKFKCPDSDYFYYIYMSFSVVSLPVDCTK
jgi:hypothetical protein